MSPRPAPALPRRRPGPTAGACGLAAWAFGRPAPPCAPPRSSGRRGRASPWAQRRSRLRCLPPSRCCAAGAARSQAMRPAGHPRRRRVRLRCRGVLHVAWQEAAGEAPGRLRFEAVEDADAGLYGAQCVARTRLASGRAVDVRLRFADGADVPRYGDVFEAEASLAAPAERSAAWCWQRGVAAVATVRQAAPVARHDALGVLLGVRARALEVLAGWTATAAPCCRRSSAVRAARWTKGTSTPPSKPPGSRILWRCRAPTSSWCARSPVPRSGRCERRAPWPWACRRRCSRATSCCRPCRYRPFARRS